MTPAGVLPPSRQVPTSIQLPADGPVVMEPQRSRRAGMAISIAVHLAASGLAVFLAQSRPLLPPRPVTRVPPRLVSLVHMPEMPRELPVRTAPAPPPRAKLEVRTAEPLSELPTPLPVRTFESRRADVAPPTEPVAVAAPPRPLSKPAASVTVGAFPNSAASVRSPDAGRQLETVGFDGPTERGSEPRPADPTLGGFDRPVGRDARSGNQLQANTVVAETGFGRATAAAPPAPESRAIRDTGFGNTNSRERPRSAGAQPIAAVTPGGFDNARESQPVSRAAPPPPPTVIPVEVLSKPTPTYTDEARKQKVEGEVLLEVEFASAGMVRVLRVVRGLGYGLDEAAVRAAQQILFKPARDGGRPVDFRTTVHIVFRLA